MRGVGALLAVALAVTACSAGEQAQPDQSGAPTVGSDTGPSTSAPDGPSGPQELVVGTTEDSYEQQEPEANVGQYPTNANIFEGLVRMTPDYGIEGVLATDWEFVEPNTWRFTLRQGVTFHNGEPFTADDVKYSFDRIAEAGGGSLRIDKDSTKIVDEHTVEVTPTVQNRRLVEQLVHPENSILANGSKPADEPVGTGPFKFASYTEDEQIVVERNDDYWGEAPTLDKITFRFLPDANARRLALEAGDIDVMLEVPEDSADALNQDGFQVLTTPVGAYTAVYANVSDMASGILQDIAVRQAIEYAVDRDLLVNNILGGRAGAEQSFIPSRLLGPSASEINGYPHDPDRSRQLLDDAGWVAGDDGMRSKDGKPLNLELVSGFPSATEQGAVPEFLQAQLGDVGIGVDIFTAADSAAYTDKLNAGTGDLYLERGSQNDANPVFLPALLFWEKGLFGPNDYQPLFAPGWPEGPDDRIGDNEFDMLVEEALATPDGDEVKAKTAQAMSLMIDDYAIIVPLAGLKRVVALAPAVGGFAPHPSRLQVRYDDVFLSGG